MFTCSRRTQSVLIGAVLLWSTLLVLGSRAGSADEGWRLHVAPALTLQGVPNSHGVPVPVVLDFLRPADMNSRGQVVGTAGNLADPGGDSVCPFAEPGDPDCEPTVRVAFYYSEDQGYSIVGDRSARIGATRISDRGHIFGVLMDRAGVRPFLTRAGRLQLLEPHAVEGVLLRPIVRDMNRHGELAGLVAKGAGSQPAIYTRRGRWRYLGDEFPELRGEWTRSTAISDGGDVLVVQGLERAAGDFVVRTDGRLQRLEGIRGRAINGQGEVAGWEIATRRAARHDGTTVEIVHPSGFDASEGRWISDRGRIGLVAWTDAGEKALFAHSPADGLIELTTSLEVRELSETGPESRLEDFEVLEMNEHGEFLLNAIVREAGRLSRRPLFVLADGALVDVGGKVEELYRDSDPYSRTLAIELSDFGLLLVVLDAQERARLATLRPPRRP